MQICILLFLSVLSTSYSSEILFVSLGSHCEAAVYLQENNLRKASFPFDWLISVNCDSLIRLLDEDFRYFLEDRFLFRHPHHNIVENAYYELEFYHDWPFDTDWCNAERFSCQIQDMKAKYERRINRFRELKNFPGKVYFIRTPFDSSNLFWKIKGSETIDRNQAENLRNALKRFFPSLDFTLIVINYSEEDPFEKSPDILEFKIKPSKMQTDYTKLFQQLIE